MFLSVFSVIQSFFFVQQISCFFIQKLLFSESEEGFMPVGIVKDNIYLEHITDDYHPENPKRLEHIYAMLETH